MGRSKARKPDQRYGIINNGAKDKFGKTLQTSQGPLTFDSDLEGCKNAEQQAELVERYKGFVYPVSGERPHEPSVNPRYFTVGDLPWKRRNRMERLEREEEERERASQSEQ